MKKVLIIIMFFLSFNNLKALEGISINHEDIYPLFNKDIHIYNAYVNKDTQIVTINVKTEENEVVTNAGSKSLKFGLNSFEIIAYKNNAPSVYILNIVRGEENIDKTNAYLKNLSIDNYKIDFDKNIFNYEISINELKKLNVNYETESEGAKVVLKEDLTNEKGYIKLEVISEDKSKSNIYYININKKVNNISKEIKTGIFDKSNLTEDKLYIIRSSIILAEAIILGILFYFIVLKKRTNNILYIKHSILHKLIFHHK